MLQQDIAKRLADYRDPYTSKTLNELKAVKEVLILDQLVRLRLVLGYPCKSIQAKLTQSITEWLQPVTQLPIHLQLESEIVAHAGKQGVASLPEIKNIIAVASGKGGVGKSTVAINLALALSQAGATVGLLDADVYGPSQPTMLGVIKKKPALKDGLLQPVLKYELQTMSIGYLVDEHAPLVWRGPMIGKAMQQMLHETAWLGLDYLIVDLPPGTGDIQLTLCQKIPVSGALIVTTPQDLALIDVRRACEMFNKLNVPILGVIENMSTYQCKHCGHEEAIFGQGGGDKIAQEYQTQLIAKIPLALPIREQTDHGEPPVIQDPKGYYAQIFTEVALKIAAKLSLQPKDYSKLFSNVVVEPKTAR